MSTTIADRAARAAFRQEWLPKPGPWRRALVGALVVLAATFLGLALGACQRPIVYVPGPVEPGPVLPPPKPPPGPVEPPPPPPPAPEEAAALLARLQLGATLAEATAAVGRSPDLVIPASGPAPATARWLVGSNVFVYAVLVDGKVARTGTTNVERAP